jgi:2-dehydro-3-deoxygluconokinase
MRRVVALGEMLLRLRAPGAERLLQGPLLEACFGGAEFNVLASLSRFGVATDYVTALPEGPLGDAAQALLREQGVGCAHVQRGAGRLGLYFLESGNGVRAPRVLYDRAASAFALLGPQAFDWPAILAGATRLHLTGITPAVSASAAALAVAAAAAAAAAGVPVSLDINMRAQLWAASRREPLAALAPILQASDLVFASPADAPCCLAAAVRPQSGDFAAFARALFAEYPALRLVVSATKRGADAGNFDLEAAAQERGGPPLQAQPQPVRAAVERIGAGDALVAGCLYGLGEGWTAQRWLDFGVAAQALKHTVPGDINRVSRAEIEMVVSGATPLRILR